MDVGGNCGDAREGVDVGEGGIPVYVLWRTCGLYDVAGSDDGKVSVIVLDNHFSC